MSSKEESPLKVVQDLIENNKDVAELVGLGATIVLPLLFALLGSKAWLRFERFVSILTAAFCLGCSKCFLEMSFVDGVQINEWHRHLITLIGAYDLYSVLGAYFLSDSKDESVHFGHYWAKLVEHSVACLITYDAMLDNKEWNIKALYFFLAFAGVNAAINAYFIVTTAKPKGQYHSLDRVNHIAQFESFIFVIFGVFLIGFPHIALQEMKAVKPSHLTLARSCGSLLLPLGFESASLTGFIYLKDKRSLLKARFVGNFLEMAVFTLAFYHFKVVSSVNVQVMYFATTIAYQLVLIYGISISSLKTSSGGKASPEKKTK